MKITVGVKNMALYPENDAEVHQLEWVAQELQDWIKDYEETRHWNITCLKIPLSPKEIHAER
jgi:hypothetical protein